MTTIEAQLCAGDEEEACHRQFGSGLQVNSLPDFFETAFFDDDLAPSIDGPVVEDNAFSISSPGDIKAMADVLDAQRVTLTGDFQKVGSTSGMLDFAKDAFRNDSAAPQLPWDGNAKDAFPSQATYPKMPWNGGAQDRFPPPHQVGLSQQSAVPPPPCAPLPQQPQQPPQRQMQHFGGAQDAYARNGGGAAYPKMPWNSSANAKYDSFTSQSASPTLQWNSMPQDNLANHRAHPKLPWNSAIKADSQSWDASCAPAAGGISAQQPVPRAAPGLQLPQGLTRKSDQSMASTDYPPSPYMNDGNGSGSFMSMANSENWGASSSFQTMYHLDVNRASLPVPPVKSLALVPPPPREPPSFDSFQTQSFDSIGSRLHNIGECTPCKYFRSRRGCKDGSQCRLCHHPHDELTYSGIRRAMRKRGMEKRQLLESLQSVRPLRGVLPVGLVQDTQPQVPQEPAQLNLTNLIGQPMSI